MRSAREMGRRVVLAGMGTTALAGCQQAGTGTLAQNVVPRLGPDRTGYLAIQAPIVPQLRDLFVQHVNRLLNLGAAEIYVPIASPGGAVGAAQDMIAFMDRTSSDRGTRFTMHNIGVVASAACYVFLAAQRRLAVARASFVFHEASLVANGTLTSQNLQDASAKVQQIERSFLAMLTAKTRLKEAEASSFVRRTVILSADEARRDGVIDAISTFALPQGANLFRIYAVPNQQGAPRRAEPVGSG